MRPHSRITVFSLAIAVALESVLFGTASIGEHSGWGPEHPIGILITYSQIIGIMVASAILGIEEGSSGDMGTCYLTLLYVVQVTAIWCGIVTVVIIWKIVSGKRDS